MTCLRDEFDVNRKFYNYSIKFSHKFSPREPKAIYYIVKKQVETNDFIRFCLLTDILFAGLPTIEVTRMRQLYFQFFSAVIGTTNTPSGRLYAALDIPQITHNTEGVTPFFSFAISSRISISSLAAASI